MANFFDQFDEQQPETQGAASPEQISSQQVNFFDQFDEQPEQQVGGTVEESAKGLLQAGVNILNIPGSLVNTALSAVGVPPEYQVMTPDLPDSLKPKDTYAQIGSEVLPYLIPVGGQVRAAEAVANSGRAMQAGQKIASLAALSLPGALAANSQSGDTDKLAQDVGLGIAAGGVVNAIGKGIGAAYRGVKGTIAPEAQRAINFAEEANVPLMTTDIIRPGKFGQQARDLTDNIPFIGTSGARAAQQNAREGLVKTFSDEVGGISDDALYQSATEGKKRFINAAGARYDKIINAMGDSPVDISSTVRAIDDQITKLSQPGRSQDRSAINILNQFKNDITSGPNNLSLARANRTDLRKRFMAATDQVDKDIIEKATIPIYKAYTADMAKAVSKNLGSKEAANLYRADRSWAKFNDAMSNTRVQKAIQSGRTNPEDISKLIFSQKSSDRSQLYKLLDEEGRQNARGALVQNALNKSTDQSGAISVEKFINEMHRTRNQTSTFFKGEHGKRLDGVIKYLNSTRHAAEVKANPINGQKLYALATGAAAVGSASVLGAIPTAVIIGGIATGARTYESKLMRNALLRLANTPKNSPAYERALDAVNKAAIVTAEGATE